MPMYKNRPAYGDSKPKDRMGYESDTFRKASFSCDEKSAKGSIYEDKSKATPKSNNSFGPMFKDREHFNSMHFY